MKVLNVQSALIATLAVASLALPACTDDQVAVGAGAVAAGVIVGGVIADDDCCYGGYYGGGYYGGGYYHGHGGGYGGGGYYGGGDHGGGFGGGHGGFGGGHGGGFGGGHGGGGHHAVDSLATTMDAGGSPTDFKSDDTRVQTVADKYQISDYAATYIVRAIVKAQAKDMTGIADLGLETADFETLYNGGSLPDAKIDTLGKKLYIEPKATTALVEQMTKDIQSARQ